MKKLNPVPNKLSFGNLNLYKKLALLPILQESHTTPLLYLTLDEALTKGHLKINEVSETGNVPELLLENNSSTPVFLMDGEDLVGAKQNRILNLSILAPANKKIVIPVSCVEAGRWVYDRNDFINSDRAHFARGRANKMASVSESLNVSGDRRSNQGEVWADIDSKFSRMKSSSRTAAMSDIFKKEKTSMEEYVDAFSNDVNQVGSFFFINGNLIGFDLFDQAKTYSLLSKKLTRSYAIDAIERTDSEKGYPDISQAERTLNTLKETTWKNYPATGLGTDFRVSLPGVTSAGLMVDETTIHLSGFTLQSEGAINDKGSRIASSRIRRRYYTE